jgi:hypothetical protein
MRSDQSKQSQPLERKGSHIGTRCYNQHVAEAVESGEIESGARGSQLAASAPSSPPADLPQ